jgi:hypothetical protein
LWFKNFAGNQGLDLSLIKSTISQAGHYRADVTSKLTVLQMNSQYMAYDDDTDHNGEQTTQLDWLENEFAQARADGRKIIILDHVYAGCRYEAAKLWHDKYNNPYFQMLRDNHDLVVMEVGGHDHFADLRFHTSKNVAELKDLSGSTFNFHNLFVSPGMTPYGNSNPGVSKFELNSDFVPQNLRMEFLDLDYTIGKQSVPYSEAKFWTVDYAKDYGVTDLTPDSLANFYDVLSSQDEGITLNYLISKLGLNPEDSQQRQQGIDLLSKKDIITSNKHHVGEFLCLMKHSSWASEYADCADSANSVEFLQ